METISRPSQFPGQQQSQPGDEHKMNPEPEIIREGYTGIDKLKGKKSPYNRWRQWHRPQCVCTF